jgi:DnaK suppressor protein
MAKVKADPRKSTKPAKPAARAGAAASRKVPAKPVAKAKAAAPKKAAKPAAKSAPARKPAAKPVAKAAVKKVVPVKKAAPAAKAKPAPKVVAKPAAKPAAAARPSKPAVAVPASKPKTASSNAAETSRNFVTTSKPQSTAAKSKKAEPADNGVTMQDGRYALPTTVTIDLPNGYKPSSKEEYMSPRQLQFFRNKLSKWREELVEESRQTIESLRDEVRDVGDEAERATRETENSLELRTRDRYRKLIAKIDKALKRIEEGRYGYCEETDEEIGIERLEARPIATLSLDAQERWEHRQKQMGD